MDNTCLRFEFDPQRRATDEHPGTLYVEVRLRGSSKRSRLSIGIKLLKSQFTNKAGFTCRNHHAATQITQKAWRIYRQIEAFVLSDKCQRLEDVKNWDKPDDDRTEQSVVHFIREELRRIDPSLNVIKYHNSLLRRLMDFGKIQTFKDFTHQNVMDFDNYLRQTIKSEPTRYKRHTTLRRFIRIAINRGLCKYDPYMDFRFKKGKSRPPVFLLEEEIERIKRYTPVNDKLQHVKDCFLFQVFTGMAYADIAKFTRADVVEMNGRKVIRSTRQKTDESFVSLFLPEAQEIAGRYDYRLPVISNQKYNDFLKVLAAACSINKNITTHTGRHTYATYLLNKGISIETVSRAMGHSNIRMTQGYAKMLAKTVIEEMEEKLDVAKAYSFSSHFFVTSCHLLSTPVTLCHFLSISKDRKIKITSI